MTRNADTAPAHTEDVVAVPVAAAVFTEEEGTMSGELDVSVGDEGRGLVRYRDTEDWFTIGNPEGDPPRAWTSATELAAAVEAGAGERDAAGNTVPFAA